jgi:hypothetical protein
MSIIDQLKSDSRETDKIESLLWHQHLSFIAKGVHELSMMALVDEELGERRARILAYRVLVQLARESSGGRRGRCLRRQAGKKDKADNPLFKPLLRQYQRILGWQGFTQWCVSFRVLSSLCERVSMELRSR